MQKPLLPLRAIFVSSPDHTRENFLALRHHQIFSKVGIGGFCHVQDKFHRAQITYPRKEVGRIHDRNATTGHPSPGCIKHG